MKKFKTDIFIFIGLLVVSVVTSSTIAGHGAIDVQFHDTYFVIGGVSAGIFVFCLLTFPVFLVRAISKSFKSAGANIGLTIGLISIVVLVIRLASLVTQSPSS